MERALKKWMYEVRKEKYLQKKHFQQKPSGSIDDAFELMGVYEPPKSLNKKKVKV